MPVYAFLYKKTSNTKKIKMSNFSHIYLIKIELIKGFITDTTLVTHADKLGTVAWGRLYLLVSHC